VLPPPPRSPRQLAGHHGLATRADVDLLLVLHDDVLFAAGLELLEGEAA
jgi:hypothetical protein